MVAGGVPGLDLAALTSLGARFILGGTDLGYLVSAARRDAAAIRAELVNRQEQRPSPPS